MELLPATTGAVFNDTLTYQQDGWEVIVEVDSTQWYRWLEIATSFTFRSAEGTFTAHKERASNRRGGWYWRAYRQRQGRLYRFYLGVSTKVTLGRLRAAASHLEHPEHPASENGAFLSPSRVSSAETFASPMLATKLQIPRLPAQHIPRAHVVALLEQSVQRALTLVCASAGSGKTTLLAEWASTTSFPVTWLSLEAADNDPARFLSYLVAALSRLNEQIGAAARVLSHLLTSEAVQDVLHFLLDHLPARLHLVIGTRVDLPLPLARLRARSQLSELRTQELRFASAEVEAFARAMGLVLSLLQAKPCTRFPILKLPGVVSPSCVRGWSLAPRIVRAVI
jgi:LuxR family transcriptional regulator, maltose regulon positive regulatory protein